MLTQERWVERISAHVADGCFVLAEALLPLALEQYPDNGRLWWLRATAAFRRGDFDLARRSFEHAGLLIPLDARTQCLLSSCYLQTGHRVAARNLLRSVSENASTDVLPLLAAGFGQLGDFQNALSICQRAVEAEPGNSAAHFGVAYYLRRLGYPSSLILPAMTKAYELAPNSSLYRASVAFLLEDVGQTEEAYDLLRDLPLDNWSCACGLRRMKALFQEVGDFERWRECARRMDALQKNP